VARRAKGILRPPQSRYLDRLLSPPDPLLRELARAAAEGGAPPRDPVVVRFLEILAAARQPQRILIFGLGAGDGALALARGAPQARLVAVEPDESRAARALALLERGLVADRLELHLAEPRAALPALAGAFDLVSLDGRHPAARILLDGVLPQLSLRGLVVAEYLLAGGHLADPGPEDLGRPDLRDLERFNPYLMIHPQLRAVLLPIGDGIALASKSKPLVRELGGPF